MMSRSPRRLSLLLHSFTAALFFLAGPALHAQQRVLRVYEAPEDRIERQHGVLDNMSGDFVSLMLDTFGDRKSACKFAISAGLTIPGESWISALRGRAIGNSFDINDVGFIPWAGTADCISVRRGVF